MILYFIIILILLYTITYMSSCTCNLTLDNNLENFESAQIEWSSYKSGTDSPGGDMWDGSSTSVQDCGNKCLANSQCNAFVTNNAGNLCWLKGGIGATVSNPDRNTYYVSRVGPLASGKNISLPQIGVDYPGFDIINEGVKSAQDCANACLNQTGCKAFVTNTAGNYCWLKGDLGQKTSNPNKNTYVLTNANLGTSAAPSLTPNDFTLLGVGYANQLYIQDIIGDLWSPNSAVVQNSQSIIDISVFPNGSLVAIGIDYNVYTKQSLNASWVKLQNLNNQGNWKSVSVANDGQSLLLINKDGQIFIYNTSTNKLNTFNQCCFCKIIQLQDNTFVGVGGGGCDTLYTMSSINSKSWTIASKPDIGIISIAQTPSGQIIGLNKQGLVCVKGNDWNTWTTTFAGNFSAIACMPISPQTINSYNRQGVFKDNSSKTIPNFIGNFNTLPECINAAQVQGYNTVGYQSTTQCFGGNDSPYDRNGFETNSTLNVSAYPGALTNVVYKTNKNVSSSNDPNQGEVFVYQECQFGGAGSKMTTGQFPNINDTVQIKSVKLGPKTDLVLYAQPNFKGKSMKFNSYSDAVNKDTTCIDFSFSSAQIIINPNGMPLKPVDLTDTQISNLWVQAGCKAESVGLNTLNMANWRKLQTIPDVVTDMKKWTTSTNPQMQRECHILADEPNIPNAGEVVLFNDINFGGPYKKFTVGDVSYVGDDFNNITNSIKIGPYTSLVIYDENNFGGKSLSWKNNSPIVMSSITNLKNNHFNDMLTSLKVSSTAIQVNNTLSEQASPVYILGPSNMSPWNLNFVDKTAKWIWNTQWCSNTDGQTPCNGSAPINTKPIRFQMIVPNTTKGDLSVVIHIIADNAPKNANFVKLNGDIIGQIVDDGWKIAQYTKIETGLSPGNNLLEFDVQNTTNTAGLIVSIINANTFEVVANSGNDGNIKWGWIDPNKLIIHDETAKGKIVKFNKLNEIPNMTIDGIFRLTVDLKNVPPYIKGQQYNENSTNQFYLSVEKLDPNCQIDENDKCLNIFVDDKKCSNALISEVSRNNAFRLVLVSKDYVLDPQISFGKNVDFTIVKVNDKFYLKNIQTGFMPKLFKNNSKQDIYGYMDTNYLSNYKSIKPSTNKLCGNKPIFAASDNMDNPNNINNVIAANTEQEFVKCAIYNDPSMYLMTTTNLLESNSINFVLNKDGSVNISLETFNSYGTLDKSYSLIHCNFNIDTYDYIEKLTNPLGTFLINMVCFDQNGKRKFPNNTLNFNFEISKFPELYIKQQNIFNLNK